MVKFIHSLLKLTSVFLLLIAGSAKADLTHRWSFNSAAGAAGAGTIVADEVSASPAVVRGNGATFDGTGITLPGTTNCGASDATISGYIDLPNGLVSSKTNLTVEVWATPIDGRSWQHLFEFGRLNTAGDGAGAPGEWTGTADATPAGGSVSGDTLLLTLCRGSNLNQQRQSSRHDGGSEVPLDANLPTVAGTQYHYVLTYEDGVGAFGAGGGQVTWYRDGVAVTSADIAFHLNDLQDVNNWLGRNQWSVLSTTNARYEEFRLYDHAFDAAEVIASRDAGPDAGFGPPVPQDDTFTIHDGQKINGAVLGNDAGPFDVSTVEIVQAPIHGSATPDTATGRILYSHDGAGAGNDSFTYRVTGVGGISVPATVNVEIPASLRISNSDINIPSEPPSTALTVVPAFAGLTFNQPTDVAIAPGDSSRLWVTQKNGIVRLVPDTAAAPPVRLTFFDLPALLATRGEAIGNPGNERGLLGIVFHPDYQTNGYFYLFYSVNVGGTNYSRLSRFSVDAADPNLADSTSELILMQQEDDFGLHLGGDMHFGQDGYLYFSTGDEGGQFDGSSNGQRIDGDLFSGIMRIDVDKLPGNPEPHPHPSVPTDIGVARYSIPADNPYVTVDPTILYNGQDLPSETVRTEYWANGFRNPWRFDIDPVTGEVWCADVGQNMWEEINVVTAGGNYGWSFREGLHDGPRVGETPAGWTGVDPIYEYGHGSGEFQGNSVTGGLVYRGSSYPELEGAYLFSDFVSGNIWALRRPGGEVEVERIAGEGGIVAFGIDPSTEDVLLVDYNNNRLMRLATGSDLPGSFPQTLSETGLFSDLTDLSPAPGLLPYEPNLRFWSDFADKTRWFMIPDGASQMTWSADDAWTYPDGMLWVKHFDLELERGNPATSRRIETRVLVKNEAGTYGVSYRWNEDQSDAALVEDGGDDFEIEVIEEGVPRMQQYHVPSRAECSACHTPQAGHVLSFNTRQLNQEFSIAGFPGNQLDTLTAHGFFDNTPDAGASLPRFYRPDEPGATLEQKARSYLAVNCSNCHMAGGTADGSWDGRAHLTLEQTGLINGAATNNGGDPANMLIVPGDQGHSIVANRVAETNGFSRMPPIGSSELDQEAITLLTDWINDLATPAPANLTATDGTSPTQVDLAWEAAPDAVSYEVWRSSSDDSATAALLGTTPNLTFSDASGSAIQNLFYWVKSVTASATSGFSNSDNGFRSMPLVMNVTASMDTHSDRIVVSWSGLGDAGSYDVYRSLTNDFGIASLLGNVVPVSFDDLTAVSGATYYYWVIGRNDYGTGIQSAVASGTESLATPGALTASDGDFENRVAITWNVVTDADGYRIFRHTANDSGAAVEIHSTAGLSHDDLTGELDTVYFYWVEAFNSDADSLFSNPDQGHREEATVISLPDLTIGKTAAQRKGDGIYNASGAGQSHTIKTKKRAVKYRSHLQNDGESAEAFGLRGRGRSSKWDVKHYRVSGGRTNISAAVRLGTYESGVLAPAESVLYEIRIKPKSRTRNRKQTFRAWLQGNSTIDETVDRVMSITKNRP